MSFLDEQPEIMSIEVVAKYLSISRATAYNWCKTGAIPSIKVLNTIRIRRDTLKDWIEAQELNSLLRMKHDRATIES